MDPEDVPVVWVPGAFEIPLAAKRLAASGTVDAVICLGAVIQGETAHFEYVAGALRRGIAQAALDTGVPIAFGVLTTDDAAARPSTGPAARRATRATRRPAPRSRWSNCSAGSPSPRGPPVLNARPPEGLPRGGDPRSSSKTPTSACSAAPTSSTAARSTTPAWSTCAILRPQEIPRYVADGLFDLGITGRDWVEETGADVVTLGELHYSKTTGRGRCASCSPSRRTTRRRRSTTCRRACGSTPSTPSSPAATSPKHGVEAEVSLSYGATEAKIPDIADAVVEITETGRALRAAGLQRPRHRPGVLTVLIANQRRHDDPAKRRAMEQLHTLLDGALEARGKVLMKLNVDEGALDPVLELLPALKAPTVSKLSGGDALRRRVGRGEGRDQHPHPGAEGAGRDRHHRDPDREDRPLMDGPRRRVRPGPGARHRRGRPTAAATAFHCTRLTDPRRDIAVGTPVRFRVVPGQPRRLGGRRRRGVRLRAAPRRTRCGSAPG